MKYAFIKQKDIADCGVACIGMIAKTYGIHLKASSIREVAKTDKDGTTILGIKRAAEYFGFYVKTLRGNKESINSEFTLPAIAHVITEDNNSHYTVIYKIEKEHIIIADPDDEVKKVRKDAFLNQWTGVLILMSPKEMDRNDQKRKSPFLDHLKSILEYKKILFAIIICTFVITALGIIVSFYYTEVLDRILPENNIKILGIVSLCTIALYLIKGIVEYLKNYMTVKLNRSIDSKLMSRYFGHTIKLPMEFFVNRKMGEIISRFTDIIKVRDAIVKLSINLCTDSIMAVIGIIVLAHLNYKLISVAILSLLGYAIVVLLFRKPIKENGKKQLEDNASFNSYLAESISGIETTKICTLEQNRTNIMENSIEKYLLAVSKGGVLAIREFTIVNTLNAITLICIFWIGTISVINGKMTIGELVAFNSVIIYFMDPIKNLLQLQPDLSNGIVASERLDEIMDMDIEEEDGEKCVNFKGTIEFQDVGFRYGMRKKVLTDINLSIGFGESVAFVGESGSGKSTLAKLLVRLYQPEKGEITICDRNINSINNKILRKKISYVPQDVFLYSGTIRENITMGNDDYTEEEFETICRKYLVSDFVNQLPQKYETIVGEKGVTLSGGQRQRIAIARAILRKPDVIILDEATSHLDLVSEKRILEEIDNLNNTTRIIIAHRLYSISKCDNIFVLQNGKIIENGKHKELYNNKGLYTKMWENGIIDM